MNIQCLDLHAQARAAREAGDSVKAEALYRQIIKINHQYKRAHNDLGIILQDMGQQDKAEEAYTKEIEYNPEDPNAYSNLIKLLRTQDRDKDALKIAEEALRNDAKSFELFISLVAIHKGQGNTSEVDKYASAARKLIAPDAWYHIATLESLSGNKEAAIENLSRAAKEDPEFDRPYAKTDADFESIRNDPRFKEIVGEDS
jgi:tetratricopeptide (TPR) repeat protein